MLIAKLNALAIEGRAMLDEAKRLEKMLPQMKRDGYAALKMKYPQVEQRDWAGLVKALQLGKLPVNMLEEANVIYGKISTCKEQAEAAKMRGKELYDARAAADTRRVLDPDVHPIPVGHYPKLRNCTQYPQRKDCNVGESETEKWARCKFMVYGEKDWHCTAPSK